MMTNHDDMMSLMIRQQPLQSRVCGVGEKVDRRPIDPPLIVELKLPSSSSRIQEECMTQLFLTAVLVPTNPKIGVSGSSLDLSLHAQLTVGRTVSSLYHFKDLDGQENNFFVFSDLSIRVEGAYRFQLCLFQIFGSSVSFQQSILTDEFTVYSAKKFPGMFGSCPLARCFADQGLKIRIRNQSGPRQHRRRNPLNQSSNTNTTTNNNKYRLWPTDDTPLQQKKKKKRKNQQNIHPSSSSSPSPSPPESTITDPPLPSISSFLTTAPNTSSHKPSPSPSPPTSPSVDPSSSSASSSLSPQHHRLPSFSTFLQNMHPPP